MRRISHVLFVIAVALCLITPVVALANQDVSSTIASTNGNEFAEPEYTKLKELAGKRIGTVLGTTYDADVRQIVPEANDFVYFNEISEMIVALKMGRIDACCLDLPVAQIAMERNDGLAIMPEDAGLDANAVALPRYSSLTNRVSNAVATFVSNGTMDDLEHEWTELPESARTVEDDPKGTKGTIVCAVDDATEPMSYQDADGELVGLEIELAKRIAQKLDMRLELVPMSFDTITSALDTNSIDMAIAGISITDERAKQYDLSPAYRSAKVVLLVRDVTAKSTNPILKFYNGLVATFFRRQHAAMYLKGLLTTTYIVTLSGLLGIALGRWWGTASIKTMAIYRAYGGKPRGFLNARGSTLHRALCIVEAVVLEVPVVIVLMTAKFLLFEFRGTPGDVIAVVGLGASLAANVSRAMREGVKRVGIEPWETAAAMGYTPRQSYANVIRPLARSHFLPSINAAIVQTVFNSSVVGLIAVNDITRVSDLIRSRTTEALPTLVAVSLTYLIMSRLLQWALDRFELRRQRKQEAKSHMQ